MASRTTLAHKTADLNDHALYVNRELALLRFQERVLEEAEDRANPLLERARYLAILSSNISEFYMVRVAALLQQIEADVSGLSDDGLTPTEQLKAVRSACRALLVRARESYQTLRSELDAAGIHLRDYADLDDESRAIADDYFATSVFPVLTPLAFDPGRPFPHISNLSMNLAVVVRGPDCENLFARVKIPRTLPRLVPVDHAEKAGRRHRPRRDSSFVWLEQLVAAHADALFPGMEVAAAYTFRITRDAEVAIQELEADDLLQSIEQGVRRRRFGSVVRMTLDRDTPDYIRDILVTNLKMDPEDVVPLQPPLGMSELTALCAIDRPDLKCPAFVPVDRLGLTDGEDRDVFAVIRERDILLHHPYDSFEPVVALLQQAARDPDVLAIKTTLYRVGSDSPIVEALMEAAVRGKEVACLVELKARFDEASNIEWARALEHEGVHVVYGLVGLKTHSKVALIVRREGDGIRRYCHVGTGNYNATTARQYTDLGLLTCDPKIGADASELFNLITGYAPCSRFKRLLVAPAEMRDGLERLIRREIEHAKAGRGGKLVFKMNALVDRRMVRLLYEASQAGVQIDLLVRGICCLRPRVPGVSDTISVTSIVGRFLEHSRIYYFENAGEPTVLIGSADMMPRNLDRRVEVLTPVSSPALIERLRDSVLGTCMKDTVKARRMLRDGSYERVVPPDRERPLDAQAAFLAERPTGSELPACRPRRKLKRPLDAPGKREKR
jgi:polyphosphate kinase